MLGGVIHQRIIAVYMRDAVFKLGSLARALRLTMWTDKEVRAMEQNRDVKDAASEEQVRQAAAPRPADTGSTPAGKRSAESGKQPLPVRLMRAVLKVFSR